MNGLPSGIAFLGIVPALLLIYISLRGYDQYLKEKTIFITFLVGIISGFIAALVEKFTVGVGVLFVLLFPLFEQLLKTIVLNLRRFHMRPQTIGYGLCLGLGFGSMYMVFSMMYPQLLAEQSSTLTLTSTALLFLGSLGILLLHGTTGLIIGFGVSTGKLLRFFSYAILLHFPITSLNVLTVYLGATSLYHILTLGYGLTIYLVATQRWMPKISPDTRRRKRAD